MRTCPSCQREIPENDQASFCGFCGSSLFRDQTFIDAGAYRFDIPPVKLTCQSRDEALLVAKTVTINDKQIPSVSVSIAQPETSRLTHAFICNNCRRVVSKANQGACRACGYDRWEVRTDETEKPSRLLVPKLPQ